MVLSLKTIFLWNIVNMFDGEAKWLINLIATLTIAAFVTHFIKWGSEKLKDKFSKAGQYFREACTTALTLPLISYIWFIAVARAVDVICDQVFSEGWEEEIYLTIRITVVLAVGWFLFRLKKIVTKILLEKTAARELPIDTGKVYGIAKLLSVAIAIIVTLLLLEVLGANIKTVVAFGGISGLALAIAAQEIIANFYGGLMMHLTRPFAIGDLVRMPSSSIEGYVEEIGWYQTCLRSLEKQPIYIPNSLFSKAYLINNTRRTHRRFYETFSIRHQDLARAPKIIADIRKYVTSLSEVDSHSKLLIHISGIGPYSVDILCSLLSFIIDENKFLHFRDQLFVDIVNIIRSHGAEITLPREITLSEPVEVPVLDK